ncbi:MIF4G like-domain-containing protein [Coniella lustricola]|uniref:MIF4G like-domain-containing protein n=1 Tax=Coniella lustricola TaxID=2025994 RepID=A0A2T3A0U9_9PEZI|nr:MIF4G like-domain-containing protein [Coniella lustricola]
MADYDRRQSGGHNPRKRRYRDDEDHYTPQREHRGPHRRRNEPPVPVRLRKQLVDIADSPLPGITEEIRSIANLVASNYDDLRLRATFVELALQLVEEQPLKTPFVAAVVLVLNTLTFTPSSGSQNGGNGVTPADDDEKMAEGDEKQTKEAVPIPTSGLVDDLLTKVTSHIEESVKVGEWRTVKLYLKFLACLQSCLEGEGVFPILDTLFDRAVELQTASSEDTIGTELVKIILLTIPYAIAAAPGKFEKSAVELLDKTDIIASEPHALQTLIDPFFPETDEKSPVADLSFIGLLQKQLQSEANRGWELSCLPRPWKMPLEDVETQEKLDNCTKHTLPIVNFPETLVAGSRPLFPEIYFSVYVNQEISSVPPVTDITSCLVRDSLLDTINILHFNRSITARRLIDIDNYFADGTFVSRATPFDQLRDVPADKSTWKPEDVAVDAVFSQLFLLPTPEQKLVYYHSVLTEACRIAPAAIAPSLGRAIRFLYRSTGIFDLELNNRFIDWFSHHLSNFGFTWKWAEWTGDVALPDLHPYKAFIVGSIDKEIRLSFAGRIRKTLPDGYQSLVPPEKDQEEPPFKFEQDSVPFAQEGRELAVILKRKAPDEEKKKLVDTDIQAVIEKIHSQAIDQGLDPLVTSTDVFTTAVLYVGSKSLSHVLAAIERNKERLLDAGASSDPARAQIITAVTEFWSAHPGVAKQIIEKLLNYGIVNPVAVVQWALNGFAGRTRGEALARSYIYEMVLNTVAKVTGRVRQVVSPSTVAATIPATTDVDMSADETKEQEIKSMRELFQVLEDSLQAWALGSKDELLEDGTLDGPARDVRDKLVRRWGERWLRVVRRRSAIEEAFLLEASKAAGGENGPAAAV